MWRIAEAFALTKYLKFENFLSAFDFSLLEKIYWKIVYFEITAISFLLMGWEKYFYRSCKTIENVRPWPKLIKIYNARVSQLKQWPSPWELTTKRRTRKKSSARVPILLLTILGILFLTLTMSALRSESQIFPNGSWPSFCRIIWRPF